MPLSFKNRLLPPLLGAALVAFGAAGYFGWKRHATHREWEAIRPLTPAPLSASAPGLDARLAACAAQFKQWPPDLAALTEFTRVCHANGQLDSAISGYQALIKLNPEEPRSHYRLASILAGYGRLDEALPLLRRTVELAPDYVTAHLKLGAALLKSNATADAGAAYREVLRRDSDNAFAMLGLARCDLQSDRLTAARSQLQRTVAAHPDFSNAHSLLASVFDRLGNTVGAEIARARSQRGGHDAEPADPWINELIADCHEPYTLLIASAAALAEKRPQDAFSVLDRALALAPDDARLHRQLGKIHAATGNIDAARAAMERAVELEPANDTIQQDLLALLRQPQDAADLERAVRRAVAACPTSPALLFEAGLIAARAGQLEDATAHFELAWRESPEQTAAAFEAATVNFRRGRPDAAVAILESVLARHPKDETATLMLLRHGIAAGDSRTSTWLTQAIEVNPTAPALPELRQQYQRRFGVSP